MKYLKIVLNSMTPCMPNISRHINSTNFVPHRYMDSPNPLLIESWLDQSIIILLWSFSRRVQCIINKPLMLPFGTLFMSYGCCCIPHSAFSFSECVLWGSWV